mgnify:CR=1 FL=1
MELLNQSKPLIISQQAILLGAVYLIDFVHFEY